MPIYEFEGKAPRIEPTAYVAPSAQVIGNVVIGKECYVGHGAILRGDYGTIEIGDGTAVEEGAIVHARPDDFTRIGNLATLGHGCMVHNATIRDGAVIGMRATISDFSEVGEGAIVGEMTLVKQHQVIPPRTIAVGVPARVIGEVSDKNRDMTHWAKELYVDLARRYPEGLREITERDRACPTSQDPGESPASSAFHPSPLTPPHPETMVLRPIGVIRTPFVQPEGTPVQGVFSPKAEGVVEVWIEYAEALKDLDGFSHVHLIYWFDRCLSWQPLVRPYLDDLERGLFATRAPARPNPIGLTVVRLLAVEGARMRVSGVDMLDGTPLLDIKPFAPLFDHRDGAVSGWVGERVKVEGEDNLARTRADGRFHRTGTGSVQGDGARTQNPN